MTLSRRTFLGGSAVLLLGFSLQRPLRAQVLPAPVDLAGLAKTLEERQLDAWLAVDAEGQVTVYSGKVELGTGVSTALRQIVAEELRVAFAATRLIQGDTRLTPDQGITAGSKSLQVGGAQLRKAAASARQFLFLEGARRLGLDLAVVDTVDGRVVYRGDPTGRFVSYGELVGGRPLGRLVNQGVRTRAVKDYRLVGHLGAAGRHPGQAVR
ncbi:CO/xanthine dehydrogenase Mo-binding subunit [Pseudomonas psychrotolerans]|nr:CO/xanthine dehydrogenase Mo-binding subunit [Pseudomonas psychrotolerans]